MPAKPKKSRPPATKLQLAQQVYYRNCGTIARVQANLGGLITQLDLACRLNDLRYKIIDELSRANLEQFNAAKLRYKQPTGGDILNG